MMLYAALLIAIPALWFAPWWAIAVLSLLAGRLAESARGNTPKFAVGVGLAWTVLAFLKDGQSGGIISKRVAGLFSLPDPLLIFVVVFALGAITAGLCFSAGHQLRRRV